MSRYQTFYKRTRRKLFGYLLKVTGDADLAADLMQESYLRCLEHCHAGQPAGPAHRTGHEQGF